MTCGFGVRDGYSFVDFGAIVDHPFLNLLFITSFKIDAVTVETLVGVGQSCYSTAGSALLLH
jgi:hypothetical protein